MSDTPTYAASGNTAIPLIVALLATFSIGFWLLAGGNAAGDDVTKPHKAQGQHRAL